MTVEQQSDERIAGEYALLTGSAGFLRRPDPGVLALIGPGAAEFLNGQVTNEIEALAPGEGRYAALLTPKGKLRADMRVLRRDDRVVVITQAELMPVLLETVAQFRVGFEFDPINGTGHTALVSVIGPRTRELLGAIADGALPGESEADHAVVQIAGVDVTAVTTLAGVDLAFAIDAAGAVRQALAGGGIAEVSDAAADVERVERAEPRFGSELDADTFTQEAGINERAVDFEKGCYVGQETVARMHYKGKPNRHLRLLTADAPLAAGAAVTSSEGRELGHIGTAVVSPERGPIALAVLRREAQDGDSVDAGGVAARVVAID